MSLVTTQVKLPQRQRLRLMLEDLTSSDVTIADGAGPVARTTNCVGLYVNDKLATGALIVADLELAARLAGAHGVLTRAAVTEAVNGRRLTGLLLDNAREVFQRLEAAFTTPGGQSVRLYDMYPPGGGVPTDIAHMTGQPGGRMDLDVSIGGFGKGSMSIFVR